MKKRWAAFAAIGVLAAGAVSWGAAANDVEEPAYAILQTAGNIEIRAYEPMIVAEAKVTGDRSTAMNRGFRIIADYIFGNNIASQEIAMTSPVTQQPASEDIAMTAPVTQQQTDGVWQVRFIMPSEYTMMTLPRPANSEVEIREIPARKFAAIRFSGRGGMASLDARTKELQTYLVEQGMETAGDATYAFYDAPWVPGPMRRNEVMIELLAE
ncbi:heme-binding protein [Pontixanthobacter gangjinensis]|uniref:Heme-binding protein n=1 Tax=Pontixanthobacter gangjinensis TaxID=1028742 RepID=A0A6I4SPP2_9SPHN|nr:heme-binding protein [Pontixanthobacter gangjinensis]MXO57793.1 heme-binding protein [Pontixanthobacter gangjinensis]